MPDGSPLEHADAGGQRNTRALIVKPGGDGPGGRTDAGDVVKPQEAPQNKAVDTSKPQPIKLPAKQGAGKASSASGMCGEKMENTDFWGEAQHFALLQASLKSCILGAFMQYPLQARLAVQNITSLTHHIHCSSVFISSFFLSFLISPSSFPLLHGTRSFGATVTR